MRARQRKTKQPMTVATSQPTVTTYDSGYEHSPEHWLELRERMDEEEYEQRPAVRSQAG